MFCPKCGKINPDTEEKCSGCGAILHEETSVEVSCKKGNGAKIAFIVIAILIIVLITILLLNGCGAASLPDDRVSF